MLAWTVSSGWRDAIPSAGIAGKHSVSRKNGTRLLLSLLSSSQRKLGSIDGGGGGDARGLIGSSLRWDNREGHLFPCRFA